MKALGKTPTAEGRKKATWDLAPQKQRGRAEPAVGEGIILPTAEVRPAGRAVEKMEREPRTEPLYTLPRPQDVQTVQSTRTAGSRELSREDEYSQKTVGSAELSGIPLLEHLQETQQYKNEGYRRRLERLRRPRLGLYQKDWMEGEEADRRIHELEAKISAGEWGITLFKDTVYNKNRHDEIEMWESEARSDPDFQKYVDRSARWKWDSDHVAGDVDLEAAVLPIIPHTLDKENLIYATQEEQDTLDYYRGKSDLQGYYGYLDAIQRDLNARAQEEISRHDEETAYQFPAFGVVKNMAGSLFEPTAWIANGVQLLLNAVTGEYVPTDINSPAFAPVHAVKDTGSGVRRRAYDEAYAATGSQFWGATAALAAELGLSTGQAVAKLAIPAPMRIALTAGGEAGENTLEALERGATPQEAFLSSTAMGAVELLANQLPLDNLFRLSETSPETVWELVSGIAKRMGISASESVITEFADNVIDQAVMGSRSEYENYVNTLIAQGESVNMARELAAIQFYIFNLAKAGISGMSPV